MRGSEDMRVQVKGGHLREWNETDRVYSKGKSRSKNKGRGTKGYLIDIVQDLNAVVHHT